MFGAKRRRVNIRNKFLRFVMTIVISLTLQNTRIQKVFKKKQDL